ncbi:YcbK family protein [Candidatus Methylobacter oryzae]|uniref:Murein endopeptidase K n=1 Tax=Candidatus Methylobacter oryzae TaxID=2497749 RepID=A0ABY3C7F1_9GAMM|nr:DUF882 domain-containing protein [Candidatus Methylobacter oryzae]TRW91246.1 DUF882 domain-containing protein [Candidatus Methylobacter oryzae]
MNSTIKHDDADRFSSSRRGFLKLLGYGSLLTLGGSAVAKAEAGTILSSKTLALQHVHTGERLKLTYFEQGHYIDEALQEISYLLRDYHTDDVHPIDPALLDQLYDLKLMLRINQPFYLSSGYRSPGTNAALRHMCRCTARHSLHMQGRAVDFHVKGVATRKLRNAALAMRRGGVGYYKRADFIHLDTGDFRSW